MQVESNRISEYSTLVRMELAYRGCRLTPYKPLGQIPSFRIKDEMIAYSTPDSTYAVTRELIDAARKRVLIGIYDFTAGYVEQLLLRALKRGVKISLMVDLDSLSGETPIFDDLHSKGCETVPAPSCTSKNAHFFSCLHEKVIVIDGTWSMVQSGNFTPHSIPETKDGSSKPIPANRDTGLAVRSENLARFLGSLLRSDMKLEQVAAPSPAALWRPESSQTAMISQESPTELPSKHFPSKTFKPRSPVKVAPVLSPDNYMKTIPNWIGSAKESIFIEQQYIRTGEPEVQRLLSAVKKAVRAHVGLDVKVILAKGFDGGREVSKTMKDLEDQYGFKPGRNVRILNPKIFLHCHNKMIIKDLQSVLVSSQNWSDTAVLKNREAGLLVEYPDLAEYYSEIFQADWDTGLQAIPVTTAILKASAFARPVQVSWGDYAPV